MDPITIAMGLAQFAPAIVKWLTGSDKAEQAAGAVVEIAKQVTGKGTGDEALAAVTADPALAIQFRTALMQNEADLDKAYLADRQDARMRDIAFLQAGKVNARANAMVAMDAIGLIACLVVLTLFRKEIPGEVVGLLSTIAGIFGLCLRDAHQFEFGSSRGSKDSSEALRQIATRQGS
ncbi:hypothetical protein GCM10028796_17160 [Ramlibacter monticola]|uniref:Uncharacterized protein n=1 Tax=Ramlibacter monticola TaxID=1926872 RepID=A0A937CSI7_9BURK|nr:hypothetical protein [Ramlibacter monticola]MBL0390543.1 hypothetical protein [Ramlibacter monticola]